MVSGSGRRHYGGIDLFKIAAALLVVAIHTGPLLAYGETADFMLTGVAGRLAVPFFFAAAGFLLFRKLTGDRRRDAATVWRYCKKVAVLYAAATFMYAPLNVYKGDYGPEMSIPALLKDVVFDGTFYHLWYLPALIAGVWIVYALYACLPAIMLMPAALLLYVAGLLGDSYYGFAVQSETLLRWYDMMWNAFDYTRNGLFFAPPFLALGLLAARREAQGRAVPAAHGLGALAASLLPLCVEAVLLREAGWPRHDSMYMALLPAVYALLHLALRFDVRLGRRASEFGLWLYVVHPAAIVAVRGLAKFTGLEKALIGQSLIHYVAVCIVSAAAACAVVMIAAALSAVGQKARATAVRK